MHDIILCLFITFYTLIVGQEVYNLYVDNLGFRINVGTPSYTIYATPSLSTDIILVVSANCGELNTLQCPSFCYEPLFSDIYCSADCQKLDKSEWCMKPVYAHKKYPSFNSTNSSTFELTGEFWKGNLDEYYAQIGQLARETISFRPVEFNSSPTLKMMNWSFVNGMILDYKFIFNFQSVLGLAPGDSNFIHLLFKQHRIPKPVMSIAYMVGRMTVGDYNNANCFNWWYKKASDDNWILKVDSVEFQNRTFKSNVYVTFDLTTDFVYIPDDQFHELFKMGMIRRRSFSGYDVFCDRDFDLKFKVNNHEMFIPTPRLMVSSEPYCGIQILPLRNRPLGSHLYADEPNWILGWPFLHDFCIGYNFETNEIGIADFIDSSF